MMNIPNLIIATNYTDFKNNLKNDNILPKPIKIERQTLSDIDPWYRPSDEPCCKYDWCDLFLCACIIDKCMDK